MFRSTSLGILLLLIFSCSIQVEARKDHLFTKPCATDETYQYFESLQKQAYDEDAGAMELLRQIDADFKSLLKESANPKPVGPQRDPRIRPETAQEMQRALNHVRVPTCYEVPTTYFMLQGNIARVTAAAIKLGHPINGVPRFGTLPTMEVNAYTFFDPLTKERVIAFDVDFFRFAFVLTRLAISTIPPEGFDNLARFVNRDQTDLIADVWLHQEWKDNLVGAVSEFVLLRSVPPSKRPDARSLPLSTQLTAALIMFATAHELGHVIKNHHAALARLQNSAGYTAPGQVFQWSWPQELEADEIGVQLLERAMRDAVTTVPNNSEWLFAVRGAALLFFRFLEIVDEARSIKASGAVPPRLSDDQKSIIRAMAERQPTADELKRISGIPLSDHPPAWLRRERMVKQLNELARTQNIPEASRLFGSLADALDTNLALIWGQSRDQFRKRALSSKTKIH
jgi:hypothetical protein